MFDNTEITPLPLTDKMGTIWSSFPEYIEKSSPHKLEILETWEIFPLASLIPIILSILESSKQVSGNIFMPVLLGTLYKIIGKEVDSEIAL